jgi:uridine kinase
MIGDKLTYHSAYKNITRFVISELRDRLISENRICISVGGESGCGKTSLAYALKIDIENATGRKGYLFHCDDYFKLPPADNHNNRLENIKNVGVNEVNMNLLDTHILEFKKGSSIVKPLVIYEENIIVTEQVNGSEFDFCIVEGTYVSLLRNIDYKLFVETTYIDTYSLRLERARDLMTDFNEQVLEIEHQIIKPQCKLANIVIDKDLNIITKK